jgi:glycosyltransferase involved in cell wall biosynthesis
LGPLEPRRLAAEIAATRLLIHPAEGETFGLAVFEAALLGTPSLARGGHGLGEWLARAGGEVVPPEEFDSPVFLDRVGARLRTPWNARETASVREYAREVLTWDAAAERTEELYKRIRAGQ